MYRLEEINNIMEILIKKSHEILSNTNELPIISAIIKNQQIINLSSNIKEKHSEMIVLENCTEFDLDLFVLLEPCPMCLFFCCLKKVRNIYFGAYNQNYGACGSCFNLLNLIKNIHKPNIFGGFLSLSCEEIIKNFYKLRR